MEIIYQRIATGGKQENNLHKPSGCALCLYAHCVNGTKLSEFYVIGNEGPIISTNVMLKRNMVVTNVGVYKTF